ncbi:MAG: hypothetical protein COS37_04420 [Anaerolineae bacterium CG03_land_8_20_14_0_80_58_20]|nr:MAG: hypothetical protein COS37_04420 [Anaerolineae bacterium CG03_land_8_20_14_0_80_58_20]
MEYHRRDYYRPAHWSVVSNVDSLVYDYFVARDPSLAAKVKVIYSSPDFGIPPVVVSPMMRPQVRAELQTLFLEVADDPTAREALASIGVEHFVLIDDSLYDSVRALEDVIPDSAVQP